MSDTVIKVPSQSVIETLDILALNSDGYAVKKMAGVGAYDITATFRGSAVRGGQATALADLLQKLKIVGQQALIFQSADTAKFPSADPLSLGQRARLQKVIDLAYVTNDFLVAKFSEYIERQGWECAIVFGGIYVAKSGRYTVKIRRTDRAELSNTQENLPRAMAGAIIGILDGIELETRSLKEKPW